jgi:3D (Asp-Asp-Asp) domain-containing protein
MGILFLPGAAATPAPVEASTTPAPASSANDDPSPRKVATAREVATASYTVKLTAYNAVPEQTDGDPSTTASGVASNSEVIAARSLDLADKLPFGTVVQITRTGLDTPGCKFHAVEPQIGYRVIADTMNSRWTNRVDVELDAANKVKVEGKATNPGIALGVCSTVTVKVVGHIPLSRIPDTQAELAHLFAPAELAINT